MTINILVENSIRHNDIQKGLEELLKDFDIKIQIFTLGKNMIEKGHHIMYDDDTPWQLDSIIAAWIKGYLIGRKIHDV